MPVDLSKNFFWETASGDTAAMLDGLQPNILKGHVREHLTLLYLTFGNPAGGRAFLKSLSALMKSAKTHLIEAKAFSDAKRRFKTPPAGTPYVGVGISAKGYAALGIAPGKTPQDPSFKNGMKAASLNDPLVTTWESAFKKTLHAIVLVADAKKPPRDALLKKVKALITAASGVTKEGEQEGLGNTNLNGDGIEHFGYVDGRSQPLFLNEDIENERLREDGTANWDPAFAPSRVLKPDPGAPNPAVHHGSYFILRKLEQNVKKFKKAEAKLAKDLKLKDPKRAGAMVVGRFEDGAPLTIQEEAGAHGPVMNNFNYDSDPDGGKCPFLAHIRKVNPRGTGGFEPHPAERLHIMARRGQTYGVRTDDPNDGKTDNKPTKDVGLLFMAFNADIAQQFEFSQSTWANNPGFPKVPAGFKPPGLDLVIGQGARPNIQCPVIWGEDEVGEMKTVSPLPQAVTMKGGEYFFMPSLPFLKAL